MISALSQIEITRPDARADSAAARTQQARLLRLARLALRADWVAVERVGAPRHLDDSGIGPGEVGAWQDRITAGVAAARARLGETSESCLLDAGSGSSPGGWRSLAAVRLRSEGGEDAGVLAAGSLEIRWSGDELNLLEEFARSVEVEVGSSPHTGIAAGASERLADTGLRDAVETFVGLFESVREAVYVQDRNGRFLAVNRAVELLYGYSRAEIVGQTPAFLADPERASWEALREAFDRAFNGDPQVFDWWGRRKDGSTMLKEVSLTGGRYFGEPVVLAVARDVTQQRENERALQAVGSHYRRLVETSQYGVYVVDAGGRITEVNPSGQRILGCEREAILGLRLEEIIAPEHREQATRGLGRLIAGEIEDSEIEIEIVTPGGERRLLALTATAIEEDGDVVGVHGVARDITEIHEKELELRESRARFRQLVEQAADGIFLHDLDGVFHDVNEAATRLLGYSREELLTSVNLSDIDDAVTPELLRDVWARAKKERAVTYEGTSRRKDGSLVPVEVRLGLLDTESERPLMLAVTRDVTERKEAEKALRRSEEQLRQAQKMEAVGRLAGGIAHDFNNMLTVIKGFASLLDAEMEPGGDTAKYVDEIQSAAERSIALTRQLLAFSRKQILRPRVVDLNAVITALEPMLLRLIGENVNLSVALAPDGAFVHADSGQLEQVVMNLVINARDAMQEGGAVELRTHSRTLQQPRRISGEQAPAGAYAVLSVSDDGSGMDAEMRARIFEPFFTTKKNGKGTGLGLSTVYGIVRQSGGFVDVDTLPGSGSRFDILLPCVEPPRR